MVAILVRKVVANGSSNMARNVLGSPVLRCGAFKHMADALDEEAEPISHIEGGALGYDQQAQDIRKIALKDRRQTQIFAENLAIRRLFRVRTFGGGPVLQNSSQVCRPVLILHQLTMMPQMKRSV